MDPQTRQMAVITASKWASLGEQLAKLRDGESIVLKPKGDPAEEARKIRCGLNSIRACRSVSRTVRVVNGSIVITRVGIWPLLSAFRVSITQGAL